VAKPQPQTAHEDGDDERNRTQAIARGWWLAAFIGCIPFPVLSGLFCRPNVTGMTALHTALAM
jgi:hypothetical protein